MTLTQRAVPLLLFTALASAGEARQDLLGSLTTWRSWDSFRGWTLREGAGAQGAAALALDARGCRVIVSAKRFRARSGSVEVKLGRAVSPWRRVELRFRSTVDLRDGYVLALEPARGTLAIEKLQNARLTRLSSKPIDAGTRLQGAWATLGYRVDGTRIVGCLDGRDVVDAVDPKLIGAGHVALGGAFVNVLFSGLSIEQVGSDDVCTDTFESLQEWRVWYGPQAWRAAPDPSINGPQNRAASFQAQADGAVIGGEQWANFVAEVKGKFLDASNHWACFGLRPKLSDDRRSYYVIEVRGKQNTMILWKSVQGTRDASFARTVPIAPVQLDTWHTLRVEFVGDHVAAYLNGKRYLDVTDPAPLHKGRIAVSASYASVHIDDFRQERKESDYVFGPADAKPEPYDPGPTLPPASVGREEDSHYWYIGNHVLRAAVHKETGMIGGVWQQPDGRPVADRMYHLYCFETRETNQRSTGYKDTVASLARRTGREVEVVCANADMPHVRIVKRYALGPNAEPLVQATGLTYRGSRPDVFVTLALACVVNPEFRRDAIYTGGNYLGPLVKASEIRARTLTDSYKKPWATGITNGRPSWLLALNYALGHSYAVFRYRVNSQYVLPWNSIWTEPLHNLYHTPVGWEMGLCTLHLRPGEPRSAEVRHKTFRGGRLAFYEWYRQLPEVRAMHEAAGRRPSWVSHIKMRNTAGSPAALDMTEEGILVRLLNPFGIWGDLPTTGTITSASGCAKRPVEMVRDQVRLARRESSRLKVGFYTWVWSAHRFSDAYHDHPDWFIRNDKAGKERNAYPLPMSYLRCLTAPGCLEDTLRQYRELVKYYAEDFQYLDNDGTGVQIIDWERLRIDQDYHWQRLHEGVLAAARARGPECGTFFNNRVLPQGDISFAEFMQSEIHNPQWREPANAMYPLKVFQKRDRERAVILLYWRSTVSPSYINYCVGLGITPWSSAITRLPFINAAFETRHLEVMDAKVRPDWEQDLDTDVEAYTLRQGQAAVVSLIGHGDGPRPVEVSFDSAAIGLEPGRPTFAWLFELRDCRGFNGRLTEPEAQEGYDSCHWAEDIAVRGEFIGRTLPIARRHVHRVTVGPLRLRMLMLTHSPAVVWSVNGRRNNLWLPTVRGVNVRGAFDEARAQTTLTCASSAERAELLVYVPHGMEPIEVTRDGKPISHGLERISHTWFLRVGIARGKCQVTAKYRKLADTVPLATVGFAVPEQVTAGQRLAVQANRVPGGLARRDALFTVWRERVLVASATKTLAAGGSADVAIPVPASARPGQYDLAFSAVGADALGDDEIVGRFKVKPGDWKPSIKPGSEAGRPVVKVWRVNKTLRGLEVLRAGTDTWDHRGGVQQAEWDMESLVAKCGINDFAPSHWGYGFCGIEVRGVQAIVADVTNTFSEPYQRGFNMGNRYLDSFVGCIIDYHTPKGYSKRVALSLGIQNKQRPVSAPNWGRARRPDECIELSKTILERPSDTITVDLTKYAPEDWDGQAWFAIGVDTVRRGLKLEARLTKGKGGVAE